MASRRINWFLVFGVFFWGTVAFAVVEFFWATLLVVAPLALYLLALTAVDWYNRRCRQCYQRGLRKVGSWKWDGVDGDLKQDADTGELTWHGGENERPAMTYGLSTFYLCKHCGARLKQTDSDWTTPTEAEWKLHASKED